MQYICMLIKTLLKENGAIYNLTYAFFFNADLSHRWAFILESRRNQ
jgi:hypothetical protein